MRFVPASLSNIVADAVTYVVRPWRIHGAIDEFLGKLVQRIDYERSRVEKGFEEERALVTLAMAKQREDTDRDWNDIHMALERIEKKVDNNYEVLLRHVTGLTLRVTELEAQKSPD